MCGIVGYVGKEKCIEKIISGLEALEYRGYDSAGIAYVNKNEVVVKKEKGRIDNLKEIIDFDVESCLGIGHTRWATHGKPCQVNSHPHSTGKITLVHNGIIENYEELKKDLTNYLEVSETDSEVVAALIDKLYSEEKDMIKVLSKLKDLLVGSYALGILVEGDSNLYAIRKDSPLIIGVTDNGNFIASDVPAILKYTNKYYLMLNDEIAVLSDAQVKFYSNGKCIKKKLLTFEGGLESAMKNGYDHFMLKEIYEQPKVIKDTIFEYVDNLDKFKKEFSFLDKYDAIDIVGCGSAYHVGLVGKYLITENSNITVNVDIASEYRYTNHVYSKKHLIILISQSGETADTLAVLREAKEKGIKTLAIVNVVGSSIAREADKVIYIKAGPEIAVATTKAYTCQLMIMSLIALYLGIKAGKLDEALIDDYKKIDEYVEEMLKDTSDTLEVSEMIYKNKDIFYLGRKVDYALAMEASLKLKEVSYLHSEAYAAGELKHGTISLIEEGTPVLSILTDEDIKLKTMSNIKEVKARGAISIIITDSEVVDKNMYDKVIMIPKVNSLLSGLLVIVKTQLIAYYVAKMNGCDIDKPRNLAKSVTVE